MLMHLYIWSYILINKNAELIRCRYFIFLWLVYASLLDFRNGVFHFTSDFPSS